MARLIAFGASYVFGHGLPDCFIPPASPGLTPSKLAWPSVLADKMDLECVNRAVPGSSNQQILDDILNFNFEDTDVVFVMWADKDRDMLYDSPTKRTTLAHWVEDDRINIKEWLLLHSSYDMAMRSWLCLHHAHLYLQGRKFYFLDSFPGFKGFYEHKPQWAETIKILETDITKNRDLFPKALDNRHPGIECHVHVAESIYKEIT